MKVTIIGPSYPFRGGISQYNTMLYREMKKSHDVQFIGFKKQYPKILYPGKSDTEINNKELYEPDVLRIINTTNVFTWKAAAKKISAFSPDMVIMPWWVVFFAPLYFYLINKIKRNKNTRILLLCHNVIEHESNVVKRKISQGIFMLSDLFLVHSFEDKKNLLELVPGATVSKVFLPTFQSLNDRIISKLDARKLLNITAKNVILFFGFVRPYKGLHYLIDALATAVEKIDDIHLLVVGEFMGNDKQKYIDQMNQNSLQKVITLVDEYVPTDDINSYFCACDIVALPYVSATQSAVVQLAYGFNKPVLVTDVGGLPEVVEHDKTGFIVERSNSAAISEQLIDFYKNNKETYMVDNVKEYKERFSWKNLVNEIEKIKES